MYQEIEKVWREPVHEKGPLEPAHCDTHLGPYVNRQYTQRPDSSGPLVREPVTVVTDTGVTKCAVFCS